MSRIVDEVDLLDVSEIEQELACQGDHGSALQVGIVWYSLLFLVWYCIGRIWVFISSMLYFADVQVHHSNQLILFVKNSNHF